MRVFSSNPPVVLSFTHHAPTGLSGVQADIETAASLGCHSATIVCALVDQEIVPISPENIIRQARRVLEEFPVQAIRVSYLGSIENIEAVHRVLQEYPDIPIVVDPVSHVDGQHYEDAETATAIIDNLIMPLATIATPGIKELHQLGRSSDSLRAYAQEMIDGGCQHLLVRCTRTDQGMQENHLYDAQGLKRQYYWEGLPKTTNGGGVTLSSSLACYLAHGFSISESVEQAQHFTWQAIINSRQIHQGHETANRFFWADKNKAAEAH